MNAEKYMEEPDPKRLSAAVDELDEIQEATRYPLPLRHEIVRILGIVISSLVLLCIGCALKAHSDKIVEQRFSYDVNTNCEGTNVTLFEQQCETQTITINEKISKPVYVYYHLTKFWQNHFLYVRSISENQLYDWDMDDVAECKGTGFGGDLAKNNDGKIIVPCGLQGWSHFNDVINVTIKSSSNSTKCENCLTYENIALKIDKERLKSFNSDPGDGFTNTVDNQTWNGHPVRGETYIPDLRTSEPLMVWMRYAPTSSFNKIHSIIHHDLDKGDVVELSITNRFNNHIYNGKKELIFTEAGSFGGKHTFLSIMFILAGALPFSTVIMILIAHVYIAKKNNSPIW